MLRLVAFSTILSIVCIALGIGKFPPLTNTVESTFLVVGTLAATISISSYDAYKTQGAIAGEEQGSYLP